LLGVLYRRDHRGFGQHVLRFSSWILSCLGWRIAPHWYVYTQGGVAEALSAPPSKMLHLCSALLLLPPCIPPRTEGPGEFYHDVAGNKLYIVTNATSPPPSTVLAVTEETLLTFNGLVRVFRQKFTLEDAIGSHACLREASMRVSNGTPPIDCPLLLTGWHC
jgi:hypothetical protein